MTTLEVRVTHLEKDVSEIKSDIKVIQKDLTDFRVEASKEFGNVRAEMHSLARQTIMWNVGSIFTASALAFAIMRYLN